MFTWTEFAYVAYDSLDYVTLDHKTSHKGHMFFMEHDIYLIS